MNDDRELVIPLDAEGLKKVKRAMDFVKCWAPSTVWVLSRNTPLICAEFIASAGYKIRWADPLAE